MRELPKTPRTGGRPGLTGSRSTVMAGMLACAGTAMWSYAAVAPGLARAEQAAPVAVEVRGAEFVAEDKIQATCGVEAGVDYWDEELRAIESCLMLTGVFESVSVYREGDVLVIEVAELNTRPGRVEASLTWDSEAGPMAGLSFERYNLLPGTYGALSLSYNDEAARLKGSLYRADALGESLDLGLDLFGMQSDYDDQAYAEESYRIEPYLAWTPTEELRGELGLGYRSYRMHDVDPSASALLLSEASSGTLDAPYLHASLQWRSDGAPEGPGYALRLDQYAWNLGTQEGLLDSRIGVDARIPLGARTRLVFGLDAGTVWGSDGNDTRAIDRFFPGAAGLRGFAPRGVGPRDGGDALGGQHYATASFEVQRDLGQLMRNPVRAGIFVDVGGAWGLEDTLGGTIDDSYHRRSSIGLSLSMDLGRVPVSLYLAEPLETQPGDRTQAFGISISTRF